MKSLCMSVTILCLAFPVAAQESKDLPEKVRPRLTAQETAAILDKMIPTEALKNPLTLKEVVELLNERLLAEGAEAIVMVDEDAFKQLDPLLKGDQIVLRSTLPKRLPVREIMRLALKQLPVHGATYLVRPGAIEITTMQASHPERQRVSGKFAKVPLEEALERLSEQTGVTIVLDARVGDDGRIAVSGHFRSEVSLMAAVSLFADSAGLKAVVVDNIIYVTSKGNLADFPGLSGMGPGA